MRFGPGTDRFHHSSPGTIFFTVRNLMIMILSNQPEPPKVEWVCFSIGHQKTERQKNEHRSQRALDLIEVLIAAEREAYPNTALHLDSL